MELKKCLLTKNDCYKKATKIKPVGIVVHSTGANNPNLKRYVQPDDGLLGVNKYNNSWNRSGISTCVHAFIGKDKNGNVQVYQTLPFNYASWGVGNGKKGSYNYNPTGHIQFEICEDNLKDENYFNKAFDLAAEFCAYLCKEYNLPVSSIVSHHECYLKGYGSNHADCDHWLKKFGKDMNWFRNLVNSKMNNTNTNDNNTNNNIKYVYNCTSLNVRSGASTSYKAINELICGTKVNVLETKNGWSRIGENQWVSSNYLTSSKPSQIYETKEVTTSLNVRTSNLFTGTKNIAKEKCPLEKGTLVSVIKTSGSGVQIGKNRWVYKTYLK